MWALVTCSEPNEIDCTACCTWPPPGMELNAKVLTGTGPWCLQVRAPGRGRQGHGTRHKPFNFTPMAANPISPAHPHARPTGRTCRWAGEIKKNTHPESFTALFREQAVSTYRFTHVTNSTQGGGNPQGGNPKGGNTKGGNPKGAGAEAVPQLTVGLRGACLGKER